MITNSISPTYLPGLAPSLTRITRTLSKLNGQFQPEETGVIRELLAGCSRSDLAICAVFLRDNVDDSVADTYASGAGRLANKRLEINAHTRQRFIRILFRVARAHEGVSRVEQAFVRQFWQELQRL